MGFFGKKKDDDLPGANDPFGGGDDPFAAPSTAPGDDPFAAPPAPEGNDSFSSPGMSPPPSSAGMPPTGNPPSNLDFNNPNIGAQTGTPAPKERFDAGTYHGPPPDQSTKEEVIESVNTQTNYVHIEKDLQIIIAKLDLLKSEMDSLHQRIRRIERIADDDRESAKKTNYQW